MRPQRHKVKDEIRLGRRARKAARRRRRVRAAGISLLLAGIAAGGWQLTRTSMFDLSRITVVGARSVAPAEVISASGVRVGDNALSVDLADVARRVRELSFVRDVRVEREGAAGLRIVVIERVPVAEVRSGAGRWLVDEDGYRVAAARPKKKVPVIRVAVGERASTDASVSVPGAVRNVLLVWNRLDDDARRRAAWFLASPQGEITIQLGRTRVYFGRAEAIADKLLALELLHRRAAERGQELRTADVRSPTHPAARMR
ncbi:MAG TPA: FtsQ-type POTRA domain-containing protein [Actinomycetota bacterium]|nr:FtsQ-type POTRA domain-containing protein [Actinomycetota bacterium]